LINYKEGKKRTGGGVREGRREEEGQVGYGGGQKNLKIFKC
jgi:hypothetical protein